MYNQKYFESPELNTEYDTIAEIISNRYNAKNVIEFGCGAGHLSKALGKRGAAVTAIDGYSNPNFIDCNVHFVRLDLNDIDAVTNFVQQHYKKFDVAICLEVAEHLNPEISAYLVNWLTKSADKVIFSAAVPKQEGTGHINCRERVFWYELFKNNDFQLVDSLRNDFRNYDCIAPWYILNTLDFVNINTANLTHEDLIINLLKSESFVASNFYQQLDLINYQKLKLNLTSVKALIKIRNIVKKVLGRSVW